MRIITTPTVHRFDSSGDAYDASQTDETIRDGDVLVVESEQVVGILVKAWPTAVGPNRGAFHALADGSSWNCVGKREERRISYTVCPVDAEPYPHVDVIPADPGTNYVASLEVALLWLHRIVVGDEREAEADELQRLLDLTDESAQDEILAMSPDEVRAMLADLEETR